MELILDGCLKADADVGKARSKPAPIGARQTIKEGADIENIRYVNVTELLAEEYPAEEGQVYVVVGFAYICTLSVDEKCEDGLSIVQTIGQSGKVYDYASVFDSDITFTWEVFGGGQTDVLGVFLIDEEDLSNLMAYFDDFDTGETFFQMEFVEAE